VRSDIEVFIEHHRGPDPSNLDQLCSQLAIDAVIPRSEKEGTKPPYVCPGYSNHTYSNNMITRFHVQ
jgi:hypothetical protein